MAVVDVGHRENPVLKRDLLAVVPGAQIRKDHLQLLVLIEKKRKGADIARRALPFHQGPAAPVFRGDQRVERLGLSVGVKIALLRPDQVGPGVFHAGLTEELHHGIIHAALRQVELLHLHRRQVMVCICHQQADVFPHAAGNFLSHALAEVGDKGIVGDSQRGALLIECSGQLHAVKLSGAKLLRLPERAGLRQDVVGLRAFKLA